MALGYNSKLYGEDVDNAALLNLFQNNGVQMVFDSSTMFPPFPEKWKNDSDIINWDAFDTVLDWVKAQPDFKVSLGESSALTRTVKKGQRSKSADDTVGGRGRGTDRLINLAKQFYASATSHTFIDESTNTMYRWARQTNEEGELLVPRSYGWKQLSGGGGDLYWES